MTQRSETALAMLVKQYALDLRRNASGGDDYPFDFANGVADYLGVLIKRAKGDCTCARAGFPDSCDNCDAFDFAQTPMEREKIAKIFAYIWHGDVAEWRGFLSKADAFISYPGALTSNGSDLLEGHSDTSTTRAAEPEDEPGYGGRYGLQRRQPGGEPQSPSREADQIGDAKRITIAVLKTIGSGGDNLAIYEAVYAAVPRPVEHEPDCQSGDFGPCDCSGSRPDREGK